MPSTSGVSAVMYAIRTISGNQPNMRRIGETASKTFLAGTPVQLTGGYVLDWDGTTVAAGISGICKEAASNLSSSGVAKTLSFGSVPYESSAVNIPRGAPLNDGTIGFETSDSDTVFYGQVGTTTAVTDVGVNYGLTKDTDGHWYVDKSKTGVNAVVQVVALDPNDTTRGVHFVFLPAAQQLLA